MKTSELTGALLDHWVAKAHGWVRSSYVWRPTEGDPNRMLEMEDRPDGNFWRLPGGHNEADVAEWGPSEDWAAGGPIIERERIEVGPGTGKWYAHMGGGRGDDFEGPTPLIAAMRAFVAAKFGEVVPDLVDKLPHM